MAKHELEINRDEHDESLSAKKVSIVAGAVGNATVNIAGGVTVYAVVNTGAVGTTQAMVTIYPRTDYIGFMTVSTIAWSDPKTYVGLTTTTLGIGTTFIGLVTANARNAGTTKTLVHLPVGLGNNSLATVAVPTNAQQINATHLFLSSNITTEITIKSGVTYLTGNASLGATLFPGGGFELPGSPDSPSWIGLPSGALVVEKRDPGGTVSKISGHLIYFDE